MSSEELEFNEASVAVASEQDSVKKPMRRVTRKKSPVVAKAPEGTNDVAEQKVETQDAPEPKKTSGG